MILYLLFIFIILVATPSDANAIPAQRQTMTVVQGDGTTLTVTLVGDEFCHYYITTDNIPVVRGEDGMFYYIKEEGENILNSGVMAHEKSLRKENELILCRLYEKSVSHQLALISNKKREERNTNRSIARNSSRSLGEANTFTGSKKGLVILVEFPNLSMAYNDSKDNFSDMFNMIGYSKDGHIGSVHDYFLDQSYGKFDLQFDVIGPIMAQENYGYYGRNSEIYGDDANVRELVKEACIAADEHVDFANYDWDGDGTVDQVFLVYAGYGEHAGAPANTIWPHESILGGNLKLDGVRINTYACSSELCGTSGKTLSGIGVACHEFSHCLGLPDFYDVNYKGGFGMSYWDVMNSGSHSGPRMNAEVPYGYNAYERWFCGWLDYIELGESQHIENVPNLAVSPTAYTVRNKANSNEYYIMENHQSERWYTYIGGNKAGHGLMITHVDYDAKAWSKNNVNTLIDHQRYTIIPADNKYDTSYQGLLGDLYPGTNDVTFFDNYSHSSAGGSLYNRNSDGTYNMNITLCNISENDGLISFDAICGDVVPIVEEAVRRDENGFWAEWSRIDKADSYTLEYTIVYSLLPPKFFSRQIENITSTNCFIPWEGQPLNINYKVKANISTFDTPWSNSAVINYDKTSDINDVLADHNEAEYYTLTGVKHSGKVRGVSIIRYENGKTRKIFEK